jgi:Ser/Thr protein kinase RdoA (MazF antagonist)
VLGKFARFGFDEIGLLQDNGVAPLFPMYCEGRHRGPFKTAETYLSSFIDEEKVDDHELESRYREIQSIIRTTASSPLLQTPFPIIHADFALQNLLFTHPDDENLPSLTAIIDWDYAYTGPLYYLFDIPTFIQDVDFQPELSTQNKELRQGFARSLQEYYLDDPTMRELAWRCFRRRHMS